MTVKLKEATLHEQMATISTASICMLNILEHASGKDLHEVFIDNI